MGVNANQELLDEVSRARTWFHAKKTRPIWAKRVDIEQRVKTLEGEEDVPAGSFLCRGEAGDIWPQTEKRLFAKYLAVGDSDSEGWTKFEPHPDNTGVLAAAVSQSFEVRANWGWLRGNAGDYVVKNYDDRDVAYPADVWIVARSLFEATYERIATR